MKESYNQQVIAFALKIVVSLGSIYFISETVMGQLKHLFSFKTIDDAFFWFYVIYFILPLLVIAVYFLVKKDSVVVFSRIPRNNLAFAGIGALFLGAISFAYSFDVDVVSYFGFSLLGLAFLFIVYACVIKFTREFVGKIELLVLSLLVILFGLAYQLSNDSKAFDYEGALQKESIVSAYDLVDDYLSNQKSILDTGKVTQLDEDQIIGLMKLDTSHINKVRENNTGITENLIPLVNEKWGRYINVMAYKSLLIMFPLISVLLTSIYLFRASYHPVESNAILVQDGSNYIYRAAEEQKPPQEKEFLKTMLIVMVTLTIPLLHPLERITTSFEKPFVSISQFVENKPKITPDAKGLSGVGSTPPDTIELDKPMKITTIPLDGYGSIVVLSPPQLELSELFLGNAEAGKISKGIEGLNENLILFSTYFGNDAMYNDSAFKKGMIEGSPSDLKYFRRQALSEDVFKK